MSWFRIHTSMLHHAVVQGLPGATFKAWINLLCLAKDGDGVIPNVNEIAFQLRCGLPAATRWTEELVNDYGLLDRNDDGTFQPHNWEKHQYKSDNVTKRVQAFRERQRNVSETHPEYRVQSTESETEQRQTKTVSPSPKNGSGTAHGSRFDLEELPLEWQMWTAKELCWAPERADKTFAVFRDYWHDKPGAGGRKVNWLGTWRNWCRREDGTPVVKAPTVTKRDLDRNPPARHLNGLAPTAAEMADLDRRLAEDRAAG
jgi:hypothetical protein